MLTGESRNTSTGEMPNAAGNWTEVTFGGAISTLGDIGNVSTSTPSTGQVLKWDGTEWAPSSDLTGSGGGGSTNVIAPVAFAFVDTTSNGSGTNISWSNWNSANNQLDFTFTTAQADANYAALLTVIHLMIIMLVLQIKQQQALEQNFTIIHKVVHQVAFHHLHL